MYLMNWKIIYNYGHFFFLLIDVYNYKQRDHILSLYLNITFIFYKKNYVLKQVSLQMAAMWINRKKTPLIN